MMENPSAIECRRCGKCCLANLIAYVTDEDIGRWNREGRRDIILILEIEKGVWAGDRLVSSRDGKNLRGCPFFSCTGQAFSCSIYETRPEVCRNYIPGSSELCPQFAKSRS
ncbi:MAG: YkgJ family cysteine cluster protein [Syntrophales bacterium]